MFLGIDGSVAIDTDNWDGARSFDMSIEGNEVDISRFGEDWRSKIKTIRDASGTIGGTHDASAGAGNLLTAALASGTAAEVTIVIMVSATVGFTLNAMIQSVSFDINEEGVLEATYSWTLDSSGDGVTLLP